jgi:hypothetical protein
MVEWWWRYAPIPANDAAGLWEKEQEGSKDGHCQQRTKPENPSPTGILTENSTENWSNRGRQNACDTRICHVFPSLGGDANIGSNSISECDGGAAAG